MTSFHHGPFDDCFRTIVVNGDRAILQESRKRFPAIPEVVDSLTEERSGPLLFVSLFEPLSDGLDDRPGFGLPQRQSLFIRHVGSAVLNVVELSDLSKHPRGLRMRPTGDQRLKLPATVRPAGRSLDAIERRPGDQFVTDVGIGLERALESGQHRLDVDASLVGREVVTDIGLCVVAVLRVQVRRARMGEVRI